ncbi:MAG TPA: hypothetical protein VM140_04480 [Burkholderiales bacterium]|nr:hypothetical protein [Burkholderiales bacterium]
MLSLFTGGKADHPMANPKEARRILDALPAQELKALDELAHWHESVSTAAGFKPTDRLQLTGALDDAAQPRLRKLARDYFAATRPSRYQENLLWTQMHEYWRQAGLAWARSVDACLQANDVRALATAAVRALRALAQQIKWQHLRYGPVDPVVWGVINNVFAAADARGVADARSEFLKAAMFSSSSPDGLLPAEIELAEKVVSELAGSFAIANTPARELLYWTDLSQPMAPVRMARPPKPSPTLRHFGPGAGLARLQAIVQRMEATGQIPSDLNLAGADPEAVLEVLRHLALYWAPEPPARQHPRHSVKSRLAVAHGFDGVVEALGGTGGGSLDFDAKAAESWIVDNVSAGGMGAVVPQMKGDWLRVGSLLAMQPDGGANWVVGMVRRVNRTGAQEARVGIQTLSRAPAVARFSLRGVGEHVGVLLPSPVLGSGETSIALKTGIYARGQNLETEMQGQHHVFMPQGTPESGEDYELVRFRAMVREA